MSAGRPGGPDERPLARARGRGGRAQDRRADRAAWSLARQSVQRVADLLERDGLIAYEDNPAHRRASLVALTAEGRAALGRIQKAQRTWAEAVGDEVGARDLQDASAILARVMAAVEALSP